MDDMSDKIGSILNNPQLMQQITAMAQSLGNSDPVPPKQASPLPDMDLATIQRIAGLASQSVIDKRERALLQALGAYLSRDRIGKLEKAMRAAKMAKLASGALAGGLGR